MGNFIEEYKKGQKGGNKGLDMGPGLSSISKFINGVPRGAMIGIASAPKVGKSTFVDYGFIIHPYLDALENNIPVHFIYYSFEMDRVTKEFDFATYFLFHDYGIESVKLEDGVFHKEKSTINLSSAYLRGRLQDDEGKIIKVKPIIEEKLKEVYINRIIPLFGEYSENGTIISKGVIDFIENRDNPTGLWKHMMEYASENGKFTYDLYVDKEGKNQKKIAGYIANNPESYTIIVTDTIRKIARERGFSMKENIDKYLEYSTELRNLCKFTFIHIIHLNRSMTDVNRLKYMGDLMFPSPEDIKDSGNLSEEADYVFTMFDPNDERYNLDKHFGETIKTSHGDAIYPNMRTIHLVESRHVSCPQHFRVEMEGNIKNFKQLNIKQI